MFQKMIHSQRQPLLRTNRFQFLIGKGSMKRLHDRPLSKIKIQNRNELTHPTAPSPALTFLLVFSLLTLSFHLSGCAVKSSIKTSESAPAAGPSFQPPPPEVSPSIEEQWGIEILSIRLTAKGQMLDFRYRIKDPEKAQMITKRQAEPFLIDQATGTKCVVPRTKLGALRGTAVKPQVDRTYIVLFGNTGLVVKPGSKVTVVIGDFKIENFIVE